MTVTNDNYQGIGRWKNTTRMGNYMNHYEHIKTDRKDDQVSVEFREFLAETR